MSYAPLCVYAARAAALGARVENITLADLSAPRGLDGRTRLIHGTDMAASDGLGRLPPTGDETVEQPAATCLLQSYKYTSKKWINSLLINMKINIQRKPTATPTPGSSSALRMGCSCQCSANGRGFGAYLGIRDASGQPIFVVDTECPIHGAAADLTAA